MIFDSPDDLSKALVETFIDSAIIKDNHTIHIEYSRSSPSVYVIVTTWTMKDNKLDDIVNHYTLRISNHYTLRKKSFSLRFDHYYKDNTISKEKFDMLVRIIDEYYNSIYL